MKLEKEARVHYISQNHQIGEVGHKITQAVITFVIDKELTCRESHFISDLKNKEVKLIIEEKKPILDEAERKYLSGVIRPFRDRIKYIRKNDYGESEYLSFFMINEPSWSMSLFKKGSMYKNMELDKEYTLEELGL